MMKQLIACCGLDCESCDARIATVRDDNELREKTAQLWSKLNNIPEITTDTINCMGCRVDGVKTCLLYTSHYRTGKQAGHKKRGSYDCRTNGSGRWDLY